MNYITFPDVKPSVAEQLIMNKLMLEHISFVREVSFAGLINPATGQPLRYDFYVPCFNLIIEYDGKAYHMAKDVRERDAIKDKFAKDNRIRMFRISGLNHIDTFFKSEFWKRQIKKVVIHKGKPVKTKNKKKVKYDFVNERPDPPHKSQSQIRKILEMRHRNDVKENPEQAYLDKIYRKAG